MSALVMDALASPAIALTAIVAAIPTYAPPPTVAAPLAIVRTANALTATPRTARVFDVKAAALNAVAPAANGSCLPTGDAPARVPSLTVMPVELIPKASTFVVLLLESLPPMVALVEPVMIFTAAVIPTPPPARPIPADPAALLMVSALLANTPT